MRNNSRPCELKIEGVNVRDVQFDVRTTIMDLRTTLAKLMYCVNTDVHSGFLAKASKLFPQ